MPNAKDIESFLAPYPPEVSELALAARDFLAKALPGVEETLDESAKLLAYGYGPGYKGLLCTLLLSKNGLKLGISHGSEYRTRSSSCKVAARFIVTCNCGPIMT